MIIIPDLRRLADRLRRAKGAEQTNPPRAPELEAIYQQLDAWAGKDMNWLTENAKMAKPVKGQRWEVRGISFMSAGVAKRVVREDPSKWGLSAGEVDQLQNVCPGATAGCMAVCLVDAGQMGLPASKSAQLRRQLAFTFKREAFFTMVIIAIARLYAYAKKHGKRTGIRLNVTSDLDWENIPVTVDPWLARYVGRHVAVKSGTHRNICDVFPKVLFYDYTKVEPRMERYLKGPWPSNYKLTWSLAETPRNRLMAIRCLDAKACSVSVPFDIVGARGPDAVKRTPPLPQTLTIIDNSPGREPVPHTYPVINADEHDLRPVDPPGSIAGLKFKIPRPKRLKGTSIAEKIHAGGEFIVKTGGSMHPVISVYRSWGGATRTNPRVPFVSHTGIHRAITAEARRRREASARAETVRIVRRSNPRWRRRR